MTESLALILAILRIHFTIMLSPGPNFVLLSSTALSTGRKDALYAALGIAVGSLIWMVAAAVGVSVIMEALPILGIALKVAGGLYLIYLGYRFWTSRGMMNERPEEIIGTKNSFRRGLLVNLTSPKSAAYFGSVFAAFLTDAVPVYALFSLILLLFVMSIAWHAVLATTFSTEIVRKPYLAYSKIIDRIAGTVLVALGLKLVGSVSSD